MLGKTLKHDKKAIINIKYGLDSQGKRDWEVRIIDEEGNLYGRGVKVIYHSSGGYGKDLNTIEEKLEHLIKELKEELDSEGYKPENIKIKTKEMTKEEFDEWLEEREGLKKKDIEYYQKEISRTKKDLAELLKELVKHKNKEFSQFIKNTKLEDEKQNK